MKSNELHPDFKLNGISFAEKSLRDAAFRFEKEGESHEKAVGTFLLKWLDDRTSISVQTSGSTGIPKQIALQKQQMVNSALATGAFFELEAKDSALLCLSADYIAGKMMLVRAMVLGLHLDVVAPNSKPLNSSTKAYEFAAMVPLQVGNSLKQLDHIKQLLVGGAPVSFNLRKKLQGLNCRVFETYGMTETSTHVAVKRMHGSSLEAGANTTFKGLPNVTFSIDDSGCLVISAPNVSDQPIRTNDMVKLISTTEFEWLGRYDNVINSGGVKLHPEAIEKKMVPLMQEQFFVAGLSDEVLGQKLVLIVETMNAKPRIKLDAFSAILEKYEMPKEVVCLNKFVLTTNGKLNRIETLRLIES